MDKHFDITIFGKVQDVFFRQSAKQVADILDLKGWIKNNPDGSVSAEAEGDEKSVDAFIHWCKDGSPEARVHKVEAKKSNLKNYSGFAIIK